MVMGYVRDWNYDRRRTRLRVVDSIFSVQDNVVYTAPPMYMPMPIGYCPPALVDHAALAALEWENITVRNLLASPPPQPSALRVNLPQPEPEPEPHPLSNIHLNPLPSMSVPSQSQLPPPSASVSSPPAYPPSQDQGQRQPPHREVCLNWLQGKCDKHPAICKYLHNENAPRHPPEYVCRKWLRGECDKQSSDCLYLHDKNAPRSTCMFWIRGHCPYSVCYFAHEVSSPLKHVHV